MHHHVGVFTHQGSEEGRPAMCGSFTCFPRFPISVSPRSPVKSLFLLAVTGRRLNFASFAREKFEIGILIFIVTFRVRTRKRKLDAFKEIPCTSPISLSSIGKRSIFFLPSLSLKSTDLHPCKKKKLRRFVNFVLI